MDMPQKLVVVGNGMAGIRLIDDVLKEAPEKYKITVIGAEPQPAYDRIMLSSVLGGEKSADGLLIRDYDWYVKNGIELITGTEVVSIDRVHRHVAAADGRRFAYDKLVLATGSDAIRLGIPGKDLDGVMVFRTLADIRTMLDVARFRKKAVVIGGGLLGLEAAYGLSRQGMDVTVVHLREFLMDMQLDSVSGRMMRMSLEARGLKFLLAKSTSEIVAGEDSRVAAVRFSDGEEVPADLVVMAIGIRPTIKLAQAAGLNCKRGIVVDDFLRTSDPDVFAVGECAEHNAMTYGLVAPLYDMSKSCARALAECLPGPGRLEARFSLPYGGSITSAKLKVTGIDVFSAGEHACGEGTEAITVQDHTLGVYKKLVIRDNKIVGIILYGDTEDSGWYFQLLKEGRDISEVRSRLIFGKALVEVGGLKTQSPVVSMTDEMEVCGCNGVCKGAITKAITGLNLTSIEEVRAHTKASASCGSCTGLVKDLLEITLGPDVESVPSKQAMCKCTELTPDEVREQIRAKQLKSLPAVMGALGWRQSDGCQKCRPALNYYLLSEFPGEYRDDSQARLVNERMHANIQRDGTYSVVPRMWGGLTTPNELRAIADVADKFKIPTVKVTGGQRIDLLGVTKEDLPAVWRDLNAAGLVSGHAYGKAVRTVKTCVGSEWCRFGVQDSTGMGVQLERMTWGSWTPHKTKMGVSGCPRNCAEATIKDFGVVAVESGWEIHVAGNGGMKVRVAELMCKVTTQAEVLEYCGAFLQLYRKEARYLERTAHWIERVGLESVKAKIVADPENRLRLYHEFMESQKGAQDDPWAELANGGSGGIAAAPVAVAEVAAGPGWLHAGSFTSLPPQGSKVVQAHGKRIAVFRTADDELYAIDDSCPHRGGPLSEGLVHGKRVSCPLHDWSIELRTGEAVLPDKGCVKTYATRLVGGEVYISLDAVPETRQEKRPDARPAEARPTEMRPEFSARERLEVAHVCPSV